ncbi:MAG TPA: class I SAM-dependent DNA methyltransferase [Verrucomicrobiae bacterium]|nr:class I SAM-dependent DNA methyltransferase [Verrucomicrobiae bacterium]
MSSGKKPTPAPSARGIDPDRLRAFAEWCAKHIDGDEKSEAQIFLEHLFQAFGHGGTKEAGATLEERVIKSSGGTSFADLVWKPVVLIEMKKRGENLQKHYRQAFDYWARLVPDRPRYVVLCNFDEFWIYDFETDLDTPKDKLPLADMPARWGPLAFLAGKKPSFESDREAVTRDAADRLAKLFSRLVHRGVERPLAQRFILQTLVALFAEDIGLLEKYFVAGLINDCAKPADSYDLLGGLFEAMNQPKPASGGRFSEVAYFNGGLFAQPARIELTATELLILQETAKSDWSKVQPEIFGTLFQHSMDAGERHAFGAHFTHPADIMKIVGPTLVDPWREQIEGAKTVKRLTELRDRLHGFRVLDPACGSGNFLYIAYRELKRVEARIYERLAEFPSKAEPGQMRLSFLSAQNFFGIDILPFAVEIAKVTMMVARKLAIDELHITERALPLDNLDANFRAADALLAPDGSPATWPNADVIIGNPPFLGAKRLKPEHGADYVNAVRHAYPDVPGMADYCVYWFRKAHEHLPPCTAADPVAGRAGLVGTQNVRNNQSRVGGLDHIAATGTILEAVENQPWSGEANVHVSIVNWAKTQDTALLPKKRKLWFKVEPIASQKMLRKRSGPAAKDYELDCRICDAINSALSDQVDVSGVKTLRCNQDPPCVFNGQFPRHKGFVLTPADAAKLLSANSRNRCVVHPFLIGAEMLTDGEPQRWVIDFQKMPITEAQRYEEPFRWVKERVLPHVEDLANKEHKKTGKDAGQDQQWMKTWWQHFRCRKELIDTIGRLPRYLACCEVTKRPIFCFIDPEIRPDHTLEAFVLSDDYSFGILQSSAHWLWFTTICSKLKSDFRYTPNSVFDTFPWPQGPSAKHVTTVAEAGREVRRIRAQALDKLKGGLRALYRTLELPGANPLKDAHAALDDATFGAYGFNPKKDLLAQILDLNLAVAARIERGEKVTAPGVPTGHPDPKCLITGDCIRP